MYFLKKFPFILAILVLVGFQIQASQSKASSAQAQPEELLTTKRPTQEYRASFTSAELYRMYCASCHGENLFGNLPSYPSLKDIKQRLSRIEVREVLENGRDRMASFLHLSQEERDAIVAFLFDEGLKKVELSSAELGQRIFQSNCTSCHRASVTDPRPPNVMCCEPAPLAGATRRFTREEFFRILKTGVCYMPSYTHFTSDEGEALYAFTKTLEGKGEPARPTMGETCPMVRMVSMGMEHPSEHPGGRMRTEEHPREGKEEEHPSPKKPTLTKESLAKAIGDYVQKETTLRGGFFMVYDPVAKKTLLLTLVKVHEDRLSPLGNGVYFACADFKTADNHIYDLDFIMKESKSGLEVNEITIHKEEGKARYTWIEENGIWKRQYAQ